MAKQIIKFIGWAIAFIIVLVPAIFVKAEEKISSSELIFHAWGDFFALFPGFVGFFLRSAFYKLTIEHCSLNVHIFYNTIIAHRETQIEDKVTITSFTTIGRCHIGGGTGIGSGCHLTSGRYQHPVTAEGVDFSAPMNASKITIGKKVWIGDGCTIMANVGDGAVIGAGSVVVKEIPAYSIAVGNPAKVIRRTKEADNK